jgi:hypothetical protein
VPAHGRIPGNVERKSNEANSPSSPPPARSNGTHRCRCIPLSPRQENAVASPRRNRFSDALIREPTRDIGDLVDRCRSERVRRGDLPSFGAVVLCSPIPALRGQSGPARGRRRPARRCHSRSGGRVAENIVRALRASATQAERTSPAHPPGCVEPDERFSRVGMTRGTASSVVAVADGCGWRSTGPQKLVRTER